MNTLHTLVVMTSNQAPNFSVNATEKSLKAILLIAISLVLAWLTFKALIGHAREGNYKAAANVGIASIVAMVPLALGASVIAAMGYGAALLEFVVGLAS
jgi:cell division inhibitor SulA